MTTNQKPDAEIAMQCSQTRKRFRLQLKRQGQDAVMIGAVKMKTALFSFFNQDSSKPKTIKFRNLITQDGLDAFCPYCKTPDHFFCEECATYSCLRQGEPHICPKCRNVVTTFSKLEEHTATSSGSQRSIGQKKSNSLPKSSTPPRITKR